MPAKNASRKEKTDSVSAVLLVLGIFLVLRIAMVYLDLPGIRAWGLDGARYLTSGTLVALSLWVPLLLCLPRITGWLGDRLGLEREQELSWGLIAFGTLSAAVLSWYAPVAYAFLGDGTWYAAELYRRILDPGYASSMVKPSAWLTGHLLHLMAAWTDPENVRLPFRILGVAGAIVAVGSTLFFFRRERPWLRWFAVAFFLLGGGSLLFFGYIELYALVFAFVIGYLAAAWSVFRHGSAAWIPGVFLVTGALFGLTALFLLPSYLLLLHWKVRGETGGPISLSHAAGLLAALPFTAVLVGYAVMGLTSDNPWLVAVFPYERIFEGVNVGWQAYVLTTPARWMDIFNALLLSSGVPIAVLAGLIPFREARSALTKPGGLFGIVLLSSSAALLVFGNSFLGLARDWDLAAIPATAMSFLPLLLLASLRDAGKKGLFRVAPAACCAAAAGLLLWHQVNADEDVSAERFTDIVRMDAGQVLPMNTYTAWENLRKFHRAEGLTPAYFSVLREMIGTGYHKLRTYNEYLSSILQLQDRPARMEQFSWLLSQLDSEIGARAEKQSFRYISDREKRELTARVLLVLAQTGEGTLASEWIKRFRPELAAWPELRLVEVVSGTYNGLLDPPAAAASAVDSLTADAFLIMSVGGIHEQYGRFADAGAWYRRALAMEPSAYPSWYLVAARLYIDRLGDMQSGRELLDSCVAAVPDTREAQAAREMLSRLPG